MIRSLKIYTFGLLVDDAKLNELPLHLTRMVSLQTAAAAVAGGPATGRAPPPPSSSSSSSFGGFSFDSFLRSFEIGFDTFVSQVDQLIATPIVLPDSLKNPLLALDASPPPPPAAGSGTSGAAPAGPMPPFFGSSMRALVLDERRCAHAHLDPYLGVPAQALRMLNFLTHHVQTPQLFRMRPSAAAVEEFKRQLEAEKALAHGSLAPNRDEVAVVSTVLVTWLSQLPEPLFGYDHYHAIVSCEAIEDDAERVRLLTMLLADAPWYNRPLLARLFAFCAKCLAPENAQSNQLNLIAVALLVTPICLRPPPGDALYATYAAGASGSGGSAAAAASNDAIVMAITAAASGIVRFLLEHAAEIVLQPLHDELRGRQQALTAKCRRIRFWQRELTAELDWDVYVALGRDADAAAPRRRPRSASGPHVIDDDDEDGDGGGDSFDGGAGDDADDGDPATAARRRYDDVDGYVRRLWKALRPVHLRVLRAADGAAAADASYQATTAADALLRFDANADADGGAEVKASDAGDDAALSARTRDALEASETDFVSRVSRAGLLDDARWRDCAFALSQRALGDLQQAPGGLVALKCLVLFCETYPDRAPAVALAFAQERRRFCSLPQVALKLAQFVAEVLALAPSAAFSARTVDQSAPLAHLARQPAWPLLTTATASGDYGVVADVFAVALFAFDELWRGHTDVLHAPATLETLSQTLYHTRSVLWELVLQRPATVARLWELWAAVRLAQAERIFALQRKAAVQHRPLGQLTAAYAAPRTVVVSHTAQGDVVGTAAVLRPAATATATAPSGASSTSSSASSSTRRPAAGDGLVDLSLDTDDDVDDASATATATASAAAATAAAALRSDSSDSSDDDDADDGDGFDGDGFEPDGFASPPPTAAAASAAAASDDDDDATPAAAATTTPLRLDLRSSAAPTLSRRLSTGSAAVAATAAAAPPTAPDARDRLLLGSGIHTVVPAAATGPAATTAAATPTGDGDAALLLAHSTTAAAAAAMLATAARADLDDDAAAEAAATAAASAAATGDDVDAERAAMLQRTHEAKSLLMEDAHNEVRNRVAAAADMLQQLRVTWHKRHPAHGLRTVVRGGSTILTPAQVVALELRLPQTLQCYDWQLVYRLSLHGAALHTLFAQARGAHQLLLVLREDSPRGAVFGAVITDALRVGERDKYYGNGSTALFSFYDAAAERNVGDRDADADADGDAEVGGDAVQAPDAPGVEAAATRGAALAPRLRYYPWSYRNSYFLLACRDYLALGGGGHFGLFLDADLLRGSSGDCATFNSPTLGSRDDFAVLSCEVFALQPPGRP